MSLEEITSFRLTDPLHYIWKSSSFTAVSLNAAKLFTFKFKGLRNMPRKNHKQFLVNYFFHSLFFFFDLSLVTFSPTATFTSA